MNLSKLKNAFPPMPEQCRDAMLTAVGSEPEEKKKMKRPVRLAILLAAMTLALTSAAYAVTRPQILDWLLGRGPAGTWLESAAQTVHGSASADGVNITVTSLVYDGERLTFSYEASVDDPTQAVLVAPDDTITLNGVPAVMDAVSAMDRRMVPSPRLDMLPVRRNPILAGAWSGTLPELAGTVDAEAAFLIYRPKKGFAIVDEWDELSSDLSAEPDDDARAEKQDRLNAISALTNAVVIGNDPEAWRADGYALVDPDGTPWTDGEDDGDAFAMTRLTVRFRFSADTAAIYNFSDAPDVPLRDATLRVDSFRLSPLATRVRVELIPLENTEEAARLLSDAYGEALLTDENGHEVEYAEMDYLCSVNPTVCQAEGRWVCRYDLDMPGLQALPQSIGLTAASGDLIRFPLTP